MSRRARQLALITRGIGRRGETRHSVAPRIHAAGYTHWQGRARRECRVPIAEDLRARFVDEEPPGYLTMYQAMRLLSVSRQTVLQRVKLQAIHVKRGKKKGLRIRKQVAIN
jgi:hypothetical protein